MISLENINIGYDKKVIVRDVNLRIKKGTITTIIGKNGCGKSTLLKTASCISKPISGNILLDNKNINHMTSLELAKNISFLPQNRDIPNINVYNLVKHGRYPHLGFSKILSKQDSYEIENAIDTMGLEKFIDTPLYKLSGGERQKAYMAMVLAQGTDYIFLDEPTTFLDIGHQFELMCTLCKLKQTGKSILMVLHDISQALLYSDFLCVINYGKVVFENTPENIFNTKTLEEVFKVSCVPIFNSYNKIINYSIYPI